MTKNILCAFILLIHIIPSTLYAQSEATFVSYPSLTPNGTHIYFSYESDLWKVDIDGGQAYRVTAMEGNEIAPRISPDGKWLAFSSNQNGNMDVYIMPLDGGVILQLTFHDTDDLVDSWSWDSQTIYFTSSRANRFTSFKVGICGGTPERIFDHYFNTIHNVVEMPDGSLLFNDSWESYSAANRKRYKGAFNPDILQYNPKTKSFMPLTDYEGKDFWMSVTKSGLIYFTSDEGNQEYNLYTLNEGKKTALTQFDTSIKRPFVSADGTKIVFEKDYQIYIYDIASQNVSQPKISIVRNPVLNKEKEYNIAAHISNMDISPDGKKIAFVSRGELFVSDISGKFVRQMPGIGERVMEVKWLKDNKTLLYNQTFRGYLNWFTRSADGSDTPLQRTEELRNNRDLAFNHDFTKATYVSGRDELRILDLNTFMSTTVVHDEIWAFQNSKPSFSPDGKYVLFTARRNFEEDLFVYHIETKQVINLTNTGVSETSPYWSPDGKYIYFASNRTKPSYPTGMQNSSIYRLALDRFEEPFRAAKFDDLFKEEDIDIKKKDKKGKTEEKDKKAPVVVTINLDGIMDRVERVSPAFGMQNNPQVFLKDEKTFVVYYSNHGEGKHAMYKTTLEPFEKNKTEKLTDGSLRNIIQVKDKFYAIYKNNIHQIELDKNKVEEIPISYKFQKNLKQEFKQMFEEAWAGIDENFYDENFHGLDWSKTKEKYENYLPYLNNRSDLRTLLNDMLGELNASHLGFNSSGPEEKKYHRAVTNEIGVIFDVENPYRITEVLKKGPAAKKGVDIQKGDILIAVNGQKVDPKVDRDYYFTYPDLHNELQLTLQRQTNLIETRVRPLSNAAFKTLLYDRWIEDNRQLVDQLGNHRIAYTHMKNMTGQELERFLLDMAQYETTTEATIVDLRYNTGGNVHDEVLNFLARKPYLQWQYRGGQRSPQGNFAPSGKPIVLLINHQSLSDAEMTAAGFKALKLGKVIGTETYRWIIFTSSKSLVDGSSYRVPAWGCYTLEGDNLELTGVSPDIYVKNTFVDKIEGRDPQLEKAVEEILKELK